MLRNIVSLQYSSKAIVMTTTTVKQLPYGNSNFSSVITGNYAYIDKTRFIELLENEPNKYQFFIRPRKFGKSLFFSILDHYYDVNKANDFEKLFGNLYIGQHPTPQHNSYLMIQFNFSGLKTDTPDRFANDFDRNIEFAVQTFLSKYAYLFPDAKELIQEIKDTHPGSGALRLAYQVAIAAGKRIFVVIDEYDHFANDLIAMGTRLGDDVYRRMVRANGLVRDFYETLKIGSSDAVDRIFITGISPVMMDDLTSGFNIADNFTLDVRYNEMMGFTGEEVNALMKETGVDPGLISVDMEMYYNGYLFHKDGEHRVYNPSMILYFFNQILKFRKTPEYIIDDNLKTDYGRLQRLVQNEPNREKLMEIVRNNGIIADIISKFSIDRLPDNKYFVSLLFYMGLLTIDKYEQARLYLKIPNYSIQTIYWEYIEQLTLDRNQDVMIDLSEQKEAIWELAYRGNSHAYIEYISQHVFSRLSNRDLERFDEKYIKIMLLNGLFQSRLYVPLSEKEVEQGYMDIYLQRSPLLPDIPYEWVWEIKYLKKGDETNGEALQAKKKEARSQLVKYRKSQFFAGRTDVRFLSVLFIGKDRYEIEEITDGSSDTAFQTDL
jgi:hypothetical protein